MGGFGFHTTRLVYSGTSHATKWLFHLECDKLKPYIFNVYLVQTHWPQPKKMTELSSYSCMVTTRQLVTLQEKQSLCCVRISRTD
jgi:hypothetical protein